MNMTPTTKRFATACFLSVLGFAGLTNIEAPGSSIAAQSVGFDVAMDGTSFFFEGGTNQAGVPANGTPFVVQGYIYPEGTLDQFGALSGVLPDGSPEFPQLVIGNWICRGWHLQDGDAITGPIVTTQQLFDFDLNNPGLETIATDGIELADFGVPFRRVITGGTGTFNGLSGQHVQTYVGNGVNSSGGFNTSFEFDLRGPIGR